MKTSYSLRCALILVSIGIGNNSFAQVNTFEKTFGGNKSDYGHAFAVTSDGGFIITGLTLSFGDTLGDTYLVKTDASGNQQWVKIISGPQLEGGNSVVQTTDGGFLVAGETTSNTNGLKDILVFKIDAGGNLLWSRNYGGSFDEDGYGLCAANGGGFVVSGSTKSFGSGDADVYIIKIDDEGIQLWSRNYGGINDDIGTYPPSCVAATWVPMSEIMAA